MSRLENFQFFIFVVHILVHNFDCGVGYMVDSNPYRHTEILDSLGKYLLEWQVDWLQKRVTFNVTVKTKGYVGFGLSDNGKMTGADIVVGGMLPNGQTYFSDRHAVGNQVPEEDPSQDWKLHEARENRTHTFLSFSRDFDTCDPQDYAIRQDKIAIIWCYGQRDEVIYHHGERGVFQVYLLNPNYTPKIEVDNYSGRRTATYPTTGEELQVWTINSMLEIPTDDTTYWCTIHKGPELVKKHHIVGLDVRFGNDESQRHVHHMLVYKCNSAHGRNDTEMFSNFVQYKGQQCLSPRNPTGPMPTEYCTELLMGWAVGGRAFFNPPHVGFPFGTSSKEYYLLQIHYDNVNQVARQVVDVKLDFFYTDELRPHEGGMLNLRHTTPGIPPSLLIPPSSITHKIHGICGSHCTREMFPGKGISIYGLTLHTHNSGKKIKIQHFRQTKELPWIVSDDNYGSDYQQFRVLPEERKVLPWDVMVLTCEYDNTWTNGTVVGGYSTRQEMCSAFILYYNKIHEFQTCSSEIGSPDYRQRLLSGVRNITWSNADLEFLVDGQLGWGQQHPLQGMKISEVSDNYVDWTIERRNELQKFQLTSQHVNWCYPELYAWGAPVNTPPTELVSPRPRRQKQPSRSIGKRRRRRQSGVGGGGLTPTIVPKYEPEWEDPRRFSHYPKEAKKYVPPKRICGVKL